MKTSESPEVSGKYKHTEAGINKQCVCSLSLNVNAVVRSILLKSKNVRTEGALILNLFFDMIKNEQARTHPSFSHGPHSKHEVEKANKTVHRARDYISTVSLQVAYDLKLNIKLNQHLSFSLVKHVQLIQPLNLFQ
jgi:hypothetical protein